MPRMRIWPHSPAGENGALKAQMIGWQKSKNVWQVSPSWHQFPVSHSGQVQTSTITLLYRGLGPAVPESNPMDQRGLSVLVPAPDTPELPDSWWGKAFVVRLPNSSCPISSSLGWGAVRTQVTWRMKRARRFGYFS